MPIGYTSTTTPSSTGNTSGGGSWIPGAVGGVFSSWINARQQKKEREHRTKTEADRRKYDLEQWHRANLYNHPLEQMQRLRDAGLNPNMIYGSSPGSAVGNAGQVPIAKAPEINYSNWAQPGIDTYQNVKVNQATANNLNTSALKNVTQANLDKSKTKQITDLLSGQVEIQNEQIKQSKTKTFMDALKRHAATIPGKGLIAKSMAEVETAIIGRDRADLEKAVSKLNSDLAKKGIKASDPLAVRVMATILGIDLSQELTTDQAQQMRDFMKDPWTHVIDILK